MEQSYITALFALGGALIGALASFAGIWISQRQETKRALRHELIAAATTLWNRKYEHSLHVTGNPLLPLGDYLIDFLFLERIIEDGSHLSDEALLERLRLQDERFRKIAEYRYDWLRQFEDS